MIFENLFRAVRLVTVRPATRPSLLSLEDRWLKMSDMVVEDVGEEGFAVAEDSLTGKIRSGISP